MHIAASKWRSNEDDCHSCHHEGTAHLREYLRQG